MVSKLKNNCNSDTIGVVNAVKLLCAWIAILIASKFTFCVASSTRYWNNIARAVLFGGIIVFVGTSFAQLHAQTSDPVITVEINPYKWHESTFQAEYIFVSDKEPSANIIINYEVVPSGGGTAIRKSVTMEMGEHEVRSAVSEAHSEVRVLDGTGYEKGTSNATATYVEPTEVPATKYGLQIVFDKATVLEGESARLTMRITPVRPTAATSGQPDTRVDYYEFYNLLSTTYSDYFASTEPINLEWSITEKDVEYQSAEIAFKDNTNVGDSLDIILTPDNSATTAWLNYELASATIRFIDNDGKPQVSITSNKTVITEGESFKLTISGTPKPATGSDITVNYTPTNSVYFSHSGTSVSLTNSNPSRNITINTLDRTQTDGDGDITFTLSDGGTNYGLVEANKAVTIKIVDKQTPRPQISANNNSVNIVNEGATSGITFNVVSNVNASMGGLTVNYEISETGNFVDSASKGKKSLIIPANSRTAPVSVDLVTADETDFSADVVVTLRILPDENSPRLYNLASNNSAATVLVTDVGTERPSDGIYIARVGSGTVDEGEDFTFQIGAPAAIATARIIKVNYGGLSTDNFLNTAPNPLVTIPANLTSVDVDISTTDDTIFDVDGDFDISILPPTPPETSSYAISDGNQSISIPINDDDAFLATGVSIRALASEVKTESAVRFQLVSQVAMTEDVSFKVEITQGPNDSVFKSTQGLSNCSTSTSTPPIVSCNIQITNASNSANFAIELEDDDVHDPIATLVATIREIVDANQLSNTAPTIASAPNNSATVSVLDDDAPPVLKLEAPSNVTNNSFTETGVNEELRFIAKIKLDSSKGITTTASVSVITLRYSVRQQVGNFLLASDVGLNQTEDIVAFGNGVTLLLNVRGNNMDERDGRFTISLEPDSDSNNPTYTVSEVAEENSITIDVKDDEVPLISVQAPNVREGDGIIATVKSDIQPWRDLTVYLCIRDAESSSMCPDSIPNEDGRGDVLATDIPDSIILPSDGSSVNPGIPLNINTTDDDVIEPGLGQVEIFAYVKNAETDGYRIDEDGTNSGTTVIVQDRDPEISIEAVGGSSVNEGDPAKFRITSNNTVEDGSQLTVYIDITQKGGFLDVTTMPTETDDDPPIPILVTPNTMPPQATLSVSIAAGKNSAEFSIKTNTDTSARPSGIITATIANPAAPQAYYRDTNYSASIFVNDAQNELPEISIEAVSVADGQTTPVLEDNSARFRLTSNREITELLEVRLCISDGNTHSTNEGCSNTLRGGIVREYLTDNILQSVTMPPSQTNRSVEFEVELDDDEMIEDPGQIAVTVLPSSSSPSNYLVHAQNWAIVQVDSNDPTLSIAYSGTGNAINEGEMAMFTITSNVAYTTRNLTVFLEVTQSGEFLDAGQSRFPTATIVSGGTTAMLSVDFDNDDVEEPFGSVEVTILPDRSNLYFIDESAKSAFVFVRDNDDGLQLPTVSISGRTDSIIEGEDAIFTVSTTPRLPVGTTLPVMVMIEVGGTNYISGTPGVGPVTVTIFSTVSSSTGELVIKTRRIPDEESIGSIIVSIQPDSENYEVSIPNIDSIAVFKSGGTGDNAVSIRTTTPNIFEGSEAEFEVYSARDANSDLIVNLNVSDPNNFITWRIPRSVIITSGERIAEFKVSTGMHNDQDGSFEVTVANGNGYVPIGPMTDEVNVQAVANDDSDSRISVADVAVNSILDFLNVNSGSSPATSESSLANPNRILPEISIVATSRQVDEGQPARFVVTSRHVVGKTLRISVNISGTKGTIASDSTRTLVMGIQQQEVGFEIPTIDDDRAEQDGYVTATLTQSPNFSINGDTTATVIVSDLVDRERRRNQLETANSEVLPNLHHALGVSSWSNVSNQVGFTLAGKTQPSLVLGGQSTMNQILTSNAQAFDNESWSLHSFLGNSSFSFDLTPSGQEISLGTVWGLGEQKSLSQDNDGSKPWTADIFTAQFGSDIRINDHGLFGLSVAVSDSDVEFGSDKSTSIHYGLKNNIIQSYFGWQTPDQDSQIQLSAGVGFGEIELIQNDYNPMHLHSTNYSLAMKGNTLLYSSANLANQMSTHVALTGNSYLSQLNISESTGFLNDLKSASRWTQLGLEMANQFDFNSRQSIQLMTSISGLTNSIDEEFDLGLVTQSGFSFSDQVGISISGTGQLMMYQEQEPFENFGIKGQLSFDQEQDNLGVLFTAIPMWSFVESILDNQFVTRQLVNQDMSELLQRDESTKLNAEIGYGMVPVSGLGTMTPFTSMELRDNADQSYRVGNRFSFSNGATFAIENIISIAENDFSENELNFSGKISW